MLSNSVGSGPTLSDYAYLDIDSIPITATIASLILNVLGVVAVVDNGFDALNILGKGVTFLSQGKVKIPDLPEKEDMPFGIGKGEITAKVVAGYSRLLSVDTGTYRY